MDLLTATDPQREEEAWNVVDREEQENGDWKKKTSCDHLQVQILLAHYSNCI